MIDVPSPTGGVHHHQQQFQLRILPTVLPEQHMKNVPSTCMSVHQYPSYSPAPSYRDETNPG